VWISGWFFPFWPGGPSDPTLAGFLAFIRGNMAISTNDLPDASPVIPMALAVAMGIVNPALRGAPIPGQDRTGATLTTTPLTVYTLAVYNLAGDNLVNYAQDQEGRFFFENLRTKLNLNGFVSGVISGSADEGTSQQLVVQEAAKYFTLANLQSLKTPWGRQYLAFAQSYGPTTWGIS
jgi:hypothetical protein